MEVLGMSLEDNKALVRRWMEARNRHDLPAALLCSADASWITGQVIYADGGASLMNAEVAPGIQLA
jgi:enoyl-[acyl-carrier-protein] reductase (NADH)